MNDQSKGRNYSREIALPKEIADQYRKYCKVTKMKLSEPLRVLVLESLPQLHNAEDLDNIIEKTKKPSPDCEKFFVRLPGTAMDEVNTYCRFFKLNWRRCHFLYYLIEKKLIKLLKDVLRDE